MRTAVLGLAVVLGLCGVAEAGDGRFCPRCKHEAEAGWRYCPLDASPLAQEAEAAPPVPSAVAATPVATASSSASGDGATAPPTPTALPVGPIGATRPAIPSETMPPNPAHAVDALFKAIEGRDEAAIRRLYQWDAFFAGTPAEGRDARTAEYVRRLLERVAPTLAGKDIVPVGVRLSPDTAELRYALRDQRTRAIAITYDISLVKKGGGWLVTGVRP